MTADKQITLSQLQALIKRGIDDAHPLPYWVSAEVSELKVNYSGHCYIELVEKGGENQVPRAKISAVMWRNTYRMIAPYFSSETGQELAAGMKVLIKVMISYHELYGLSLQITDIDPTYTLGDMEQQRQQTIARLQADGIYTMNHEVEFPLVVQRLAVVSSRNAAGYQDFIQELENTEYRFSITLFDAFMQGAQAEESVVTALGMVADQMEEFDAVVIIRGGGSQSDLGCFNSYRLCCHVAQFPLPVIAGIGHDKDQSVVDLVAARSLKTPTAVATYLKECLINVDSELDALWYACSDAAREFLEGKRTHLRTNGMLIKEVATGMVHEMEMRLGGFTAELHRRSDRILQHETARLASSSEQLRQCSHGLLSNQQKELSLLGELIAARDPQRILDMGFALLSLEGKTVTTPQQLHPGDTLQIRLKSSTITANIQKIK